MNKLVSKNPIQRFKQGKQIQKFQNGGPNGAYFEETDSSGKIIGKGRWQNGKKVYYKPVTNTNIDEVTVIGNKRPKQIYNFGKSFKSTNNPLFYGTGIGGKVNKNALSQITQAQKDALMATGKFNNDSFSSVQNLQNALNNYFAEDAKFGVGSIKSDNLWGNQTQKAFDMALSKAGYVNRNGVEHIAPRIVSPINENDKPEKMIGLGQIITTEKPVIATAPEGGIPNLVTPKFRRANLNKSQVRDLIRQAGFKAYDYTGAQRAALRRYLNGESDDTSLLDGTDLARFTLPFRKQGGRLISRNPIKRFKENRQ